MKPLKFIILLGKSGSGKGTQADLLMKEFGLKHLSTGVVLRKRWKKNDYVGRKLKNIMVHGGLVPTPLVFHIWLHELEALRKSKKYKGVVLEGSPRKDYEAWMLQETFDFYGWSKNVRVFNIAISDKESFKRLLLRARKDDGVNAIKNRLFWFKKEVVPAVSFYKKQGTLFEINGEQSVQAVYRDIRGKLGNFLR